MEGQQKRQVKLLKAMAKKSLFTFYKKPRKKRPGRHSKNLSHNNKQSKQYKKPRNRGGM